MEVYVAGDGVNYPQKGQTVAIHYTGYVSPLIPFGAMMRFHLL